GRYGGRGDEFWRFYPSGDTTPYVRAGRPLAEALPRPPGSPTPASLAPRGTRTETPRRHRSPSRARCAHPARRTGVTAAGDGWPTRTQKHDPSRVTSCGTPGTPSGTP